MIDLSNIDLRKVLGPTLQVGALRAILMLGGFVFVLAVLAWLIG